MSSSGKPDKQRGLIITVFCIMGAAITTILLLSIFDVPSKIGLNCNDINWGIQGTLIGAVITVGLFVLTYLLIQRRDIKRQRNKQEIAILLLKDTYTDCKKGLSLFEKTYYQILASNPHEDTAKQIRSDAEKFAQSSFQNETVIMDLCKDGVISSEQLRAYFMVKTFYLQHFTVSIAMPDNTKLHEGTRELAEQKIEEALKLIERER